MSILNIINQLAATDKTSLKEKILKESASNETLKECFIWHIANRLRLA